MARTKQQPKGNAGDVSRTDGAAIAQAKGKSPAASKAPRQHHVPAAEREIVAGKSIAKMKPQGARSAQGKAAANKKHKAALAAAAAEALASVEEGDEAGGQKSAAGKKKKGGKRKFKPGERALKEIKEHQKSTKLMIPKASITRLIREIMYSHNENLRVQPAVIEALHEAGEAFLVNLFEMSQAASAHGKRTTLMRSDVRLAKRIACDAGAPGFEDLGNKDGIMDPLALERANKERLAAARAAKEAEAAAGGDGPGKKRKVAHIPDDDDDDDNNEVDDGKDGDAAPDEEEALGD